MSDRLTDEELRRFDQLCAHRRGQHGAMLSLLVHDVEAMTEELRERRAADLTHAQNGCLDCEGPLVQCDCQPDCPGGKCARRCWEKGIGLTSEDREALRRMRGDVLAISAHVGENPHAKALTILDRITKEQP